jgi:hypothetical protein
VNTKIIKKILSQKKFTQNDIFIFMMKTCSVCKIEKDISEFHKWKYGPDGYKRHCKICRKNETKTYYEKNKNDVIEKVKKYRNQNLESVRKKRMDRYYKNKEKESKYMSEYRKKNRKELTSKTLERRKNDPIFHLIHTMSSRLRVFMKSKNLIKRNRTFSIVGCSPDELKKYLESKFVVGMSWNNQGSWHIDHIVPLSSAQTEKEIYKLCHFTNLQPLWAEDNLRKGDKF